jgi:acid stress-induced BolA-like protein IbaG/YrbA
MLIDEIKKIIGQGIEGCEVIIDGDGTHFQVVVVSDGFEEKTVVQQHQMVYKTLGDKMGTDIHALSIQTYTTDEWIKINH